jgi:hypothetical protein
MVELFSLKARFVAKAPSGDTVEEATHCDLKIVVGGKNVTSFVRENESREDHLEIPAYYLAEWIAENWWPLLWEPRKSEDPDGDPEYPSRHCILSAQQGFVLPNVSFTPTGEIISIYAGPRTAQYADAHFPQTADAAIDKSAFESHLRQFVDDTAKRINFETPLSEAWADICNTSPDNEFFCRLIGALGLSPYDTHENVERALNVADKFLTPQQMMDLCLTSVPEEVVLSSTIALQTHKLIERAEALDLSPLSSIKIPADVPSGAAYRTGYRAAHAIRDHLRLRETDIEGSKVVFEMLNMTSTIRADSEVKSETSPIIGVTQRSGDDGRLALVGTTRSSRRFSGARAAYLFWASESCESRLITTSVTRDQQASRAFAAEILVPQAYVRSQATAGKLRWDKIKDIAESASVSTEVVKRQAENSGIQLI